MTLDSALSIANGSLANINRQIALLSHNVANANTPHYVRAVAGQQSLTAEGTGLGVRSTASMRVLDSMLQFQSLRQTTVVAGLDTTSAALRAIDPLLGAPGQADDLPSLLGAVQDRFSTLLNAPDSQVSQAAALSAGATLARQLNTISGAYAEQRQAAHDDLGRAVDTLNSALASIGQLSNRIVAQKAGGASTADLENLRDAAFYALSSLVETKMLAQPNGDVSIVTTAGLSLPTRAATPPFSVAGANLASAASYLGGTVPGILLNGADITRQMQGGRIGADIALRDSTLPTFQAELDEFAYGLARRFSDQGLALFTDGAGAVPVGGGAPVQSGYIGFAAATQVNPAVAAAPSTLRDGTHIVSALTSVASPFTPNPPGGPAGFSGLISRILNYTFGAEAQAGVAQPGFAMSGLGPDGDLSAPFAAPPTLGGLAAGLTAAQASLSASAAAGFDTETAVQTGLDARLAAGSGVDLDREMSAMIQLQNAYGATARILSVVQSMFDDLIRSVR